MVKGTKRPLFSYITRRQFRLTSPDAVLTEDEFDLLKITVDDFRFVTRQITDDLAEVEADIRSRSTILRRLLAAQDIFNAGRHFRPRSQLRVKARMLEFDPIHPALILSCGNYPWAGDRLAGMAAEFGIQGISPATGAEWNYRENADVSLSEYLNGLALSVLGTPIRRRQAVKYVADKKAAHVSEKRGQTFEQALDRAWSSLFITIKDPGENFVRLNVVYLEILSVIEALASSESINGYIDDLDIWLSTAAIIMPDAHNVSGLSIPFRPMKP